MRRPVLAVLAALGLFPAAAGAAEPHRSMTELPFGNGHGIGVFDAETRRVTQLWEHVYRRYEAEVETRDVLWDSYFGVRAGGGSGVWLTDVEAEARYLDADPIVVATQSIGTLEIETYAFSPWGLERPGLALLLRVVATERTPAGGIDTTIYGLQNLHLGQGRPEPSADSEEIVWDPASSSYSERGAAGVAVYLPIVAPTRHACSPNNPFVAGGAGEDLVDTDGSGVVDDAVAGFQWDLGLLRPGDAAWAGFLVGFDAGGNGQELLATMQGVVGGRDPRGLLAAERAGWEAFLGPVPGDLDDEAIVGRLALAVLRMGQNREAGPGLGQIVASLPPGQWNIAWARDMAYAIVALARADRANEARLALDFVLDAEVGDYEELVGEPYAISVTRYFGNGREESDSNADGPNVELDGFGLFLWAARHHVDEADDGGWLDERWERIRDLVADVLVRRIDETGLVQADSSIWEVHWNGRQKHFAYTSIAAARGLCDAAALAERAGDGDAAARFREAARGLGAAIAEKLALPDGSLGASLEDVEAGAGFRDAAVLEAIGWGIVEPRGDLARQTLAALNDLEIPGGTGYFRNDDGGEYDLAEWVFIDLRAAVAFDESGIGPVANGLRDWVAEQGGENWGLLPELYDRDTGDYAGAMPMVGFGAGAWLLANDDVDEDTSCFDYPDEPEPDAGLPDAGADGEPEGPASCACRSAGLDGSRAGVGALLALAGLLLRRRTRGHAPGSQVLGITGVAGTTARIAVRASASRRGPTVSVARPCSPRITCGWILASCRENASRQRPVSGGCPLPVARLLCPVLRRSRTSPFSRIGGPPSRRAGVCLLLLSCATGGGGPRADGGPDADVDASVAGADRCEVVVGYEPSGAAPERVAVAGEWNGWSQDLDVLGEEGGRFEARLELRPGGYGYKLIVDGQWMLDPANPYTTWVDGVENSLLRVRDCAWPRLVVESASAMPGGRIRAVVTYRDGVFGAGPDPAQSAALIDGEPANVTLDGGRFDVDLEGITQGKHTLRFGAKDLEGRAADDVVVPLWVEPEPFAWEDAILYFAFTDRFRNGDPSNDRRVDGVEDRANYLGGDLAGILDAIDEGYFDSLGVGALWLSPVNANPDGAEPGSDGRMYAGYHGYWPSDARLVDEHFGDEPLLAQVVDAAHAHGIRVVVDLVLNHVHDSHPYWEERRADGWFNGDGSCVCEPCGWDAHPIDCWFMPYLPDLDYRNPEVVETMIGDALHWIREVGVDGFRLDAVKHMEHVAARTLASRINDELESGGARAYLVGETFTGEDGRGQIAEYIGPDELDGQFDFPLYWPIVRVLLRREAPLVDLDAAVLANEGAYPSGTIMAPFLGNHDVPRAISHASGVIADAWGNGSKEQGWTDPPGPPSADDPYDRLGLAFLFLLTQPGVPLIYYGDEVGLPGAGDPDNRRMMPTEEELGPSQRALRGRVQAIGLARRENRGLRRGARRTLWVDEDLYVYARGEGADLAIVALNVSDEERSADVPIPGELGLASGSVLRDRLGGPGVSAANGGLAITLPARRGALYLR